VFLFPPFSLSPINPARGIWELVVTVLSETNGIVVVFFFAVSDVFKRLWGGIDNVGVARVGLSPWGALAPIAPWSRRLSQ